LGIFQDDKFDKPFEINFSLNCDSIINYKDRDFEEDFDIPAETFGSE
jgi:hypothetical protein